MDVGRLGRGPWPGRRRCALIRALATGKVAQYSRTIKSGAYAACPGRRQMTEEPRVDGRFAFRLPSLKSAYSEGA